MSHPLDLFKTTPPPLGIWPEPSKFLHSCNPNCTLVHMESILLISTCKDLVKGEPLCLDLAISVPAPKRKQYLLENYSIYCKCTICEWKSWPSFSNPEQVKKVAEGLTNSVMMKQIFWEIMQHGYEKYPDRLLKKLTKNVVKDITWADVLRAMDLLREDQGKSE